MEITTKVLCLTVAAVLLEVATCQTISPEYSVYFVATGKTLQLSCEDSLSSSINWSKDSSGSIASLGFTETNTSSTSTITKSSASMSDSGTYRCAASSSTTILVSVFNVTTTNGSYVSSKTATSLQCDPTFEGAAPPYSMSWKKGDGGDISDISLYTKFDTNHSLMFVKPASTDMGLYYCGFMFSTTTPQQEVSIEVYLNGGPVLKSFSKSVTVTEGDTYTQNCDITSYPVGEVIWKFNDVEIAPGGRVSFSAYKDVTNATLTITTVENADRGIYMCYVFNDVQNSSANQTTLLRIKGKLVWLWPLLGIVGEIVVLAIIITISEKCKKKDDEPVEEPEEENPDPKPSTSAGKYSEPRRRTTTPK